MTRCLGGKDHSISAISVCGGKIDKLSSSQTLSGFHLTKPRAMEHEKIIFFRNFFFRAFIIGVLFAIFYFIVTYTFWDTWAAWATHVFKVDEKALGRLVLMFFVNLRVVLVFFFLVPALAFHWMARKK